MAYLWLETKTLSLPDTYLEKKSFSLPNVARRTRLEEESNPVILGRGNGTGLYDSLTHSIRVSSVLNLVLMVRCHHRLFVRRLFPWTRDRRGNVVNSESEVFEELDRPISRSYLAGFPKKKDKGSVQ